MVMMQKLKSCHKEKVMNTQALKYVRQLFQAYDASPQTIRSYQRQWIRSVRNLGDNWLLAKKVERLENPRTN
jgi:hypothetical protein